MTTAYTSLLGLALPVTGELSGTWGDTVNNSITSLLDSAIAGTTTLSSDADVTLTTTTGASNTSRQAILLWTAGGTVTRNITAPAQSKIYTVINASSSTQSIVLRGVGPTTGVTIVKGESAVCAWNGSDFIKISNTGGAAVFTTLDVTNLEVTNIKALDGTSAASIANSTGIISLTANPILSGGTANGVAYLNGSKVLTTGSALTYNGQQLTSSGSASAAVIGYVATTSAADGYSGIRLINTGASGREYQVAVGGSTSGQNGNWYVYDITANAARLIIDPSGNLGLGVTPSASTASGVLFFNNASQFTFSGPISYQDVNIVYNSGADRYIANGAATRFSSVNGVMSWYNAPSGTAGNAISFTQAMTLDASGNLGVNQTSPSFKIDAIGSTTNGSGIVTTLRLKNGGTSANDGAKILFTAGTSTDGAGIGSGGQALDSADLRFFTGGNTLRMTIDNRGNAGINIYPKATWDSGSRALQLGSSGALWQRAADNLLVLTSNSWFNGSGDFYIANGFASRMYQVSGCFSFESAPSGSADAACPLTTKMFLNAAGNLRVGLTGDIDGSNPERFGVSYTYPQTGMAMANGSTSTTYAILFKNPNGIVGSIQTSTSATSYVTSSDYRLKNTIAPMVGALGKVAQLNPVTYKWNSDGSDSEGFIAHELQEVAPYAVSGEKDGKDMQGVDYGRITPLLTAALQEAIAKIELLEARLASLESK